MFRSILFGVAVPLLTIAAASGDTGAAVPPLSTPSSAHDVARFGAKGDGVADDTDAIQAAVQAAVESRSSLHLKGGHWGHMVNGFNIWAVPEVVFPKGHYRITRPIVFTVPIHLRSLGEVTVEQANPDHEIFYFHSTARHRVEGFSFVGGKTQLRFWTNNLGPAEINVFNCTFTRSGGYAVECQSYTETKFTGTDRELDHTKPWAPYGVEWSNGRPTLQPNKGENLGEWFNSTLFVISDSEFIDCAGAADLQCDDTSLRNCRITGGGRHGLPMLNLPSGMANLVNIKGILRPEKERAPYWIEGGGILSGDHLDFDTEGGQGVDFIRVSRSPKPVSITIGGFCINIRNSRIKAAGGANNALCWLSKGNQPSLLSLTNVTETTGRPVEAIRWELPPDEEMLHALIPPNNALVPRTWFRVRLSGNSANISTPLPETITALEEKAIPHEAIERSFLPELEWTSADLEREARPVIYAVDFGLKAASNQEVDEIISRIFKEASQKGDSVVIFPPGLYRFATPVTLPQRVVVKAEGRVIFSAKDPGQTLFEGKGIEQALFKGCFFEGGKDGVDVKSTPDAKARVAFEDCSFVNQTGVGIRYFSGKEGAENRGEISIRGGVFAGHQALVTNASKAQIKEAWLVNDPRLNHRAFIENHGGRMRIEGNLMNPTLWDGKRGKRPEAIKEWKQSRNTRWIDNYGSLYALNNRFGGESGGMANIVNYSDQGTLYMAGGSSRFFNGLSQRGMVNLEKAPRLLVMENISSVPVSADGNVAIIFKKGEKLNEEMVFVSGVLSPFLPPSRQP